MTVMTKRKKVKLPVVKKFRTSTKSRKLSRSKESSKKPRKRKNPVVDEVVMNEEAVDEDERPSTGRGRFDSNRVWNPFGCQSLQQPVKREA